VCKGNLLINLARYLRKRNCGKRSNSRNDLLLLVTNKLTRAPEELVRSLSELDWRDRVLESNRHLPDLLLDLIGKLEERALFVSRCLKRCLSAL